jgi:potassium-transporting ATPase KdpC subunit
MMQYLRANFLLLFGTLFLCCVLYPLTLWALGQSVFRSQADGSLLLGADEKPVGSRLIAQGFSGDEYFQPRQSATSPSAHNAMASGGSNLAANNPKLRGRVAQQLGTIVRYHSPKGPGKGALVGEDIEKWFQKENDPTKKDKRRDLTAEWASSNPSLRDVWATSSDPPFGDYVKRWAKDHPGVLKARKAKNPDSTDPPKPEDLAPFFFDPAIADSFVKVHPGTWPCTTEEEKDGKKVKVIKPDNKGDDIKSIFFDMWLQDHRDAKLEHVPADMVMASGSGLDPHITLKNARYQLHTRIAAAQADKLVNDRVEIILKTKAEKIPDAQRKEIGEQVRKELTAKAGKPLEEKVTEVIESLLNEKQEAPFGGLAGGPLVNVLEVNLALSERMKGIPR